MALNKIFDFKQGQIILVKYYDYEENLLLVHQHSQWYNGNWEHGFVQMLPSVGPMTVVIYEWEIGCGLVKIIEDGSVLKVLYGQDVPTIQTTKK